MHSINIHPRTMKCLFACLYPLCQFATEAENSLTFNKTFKLSVVIFFIKTRKTVGNKVGEYPPIGEMRILIFLSEDPQGEFIKQKINDNIGWERWDRLNKYLKELCWKGLVHVEDKTDTTGSTVYRIAPDGKKAVDKYKDWKKSMKESQGDE